LKHEKIEEEMRKLEVQNEELKAQNQLAKDDKNKLALNEPKTAVQGKTISIDMTDENKPLDRDRKKKKIIEVSEDEEVSPSKIHGSPTKQTIVNRGMDADEVAKLMKTVIDSMKVGIPVETSTLGSIGAQTQPLSQEIINDLEQLQRDKINFIGSHGGASSLHPSALTRKDKLHLVKLGLGKGLLDDDLKGKLQSINSIEFIAAEPSLEKELADPHCASKIILKFVVLKTDGNEHNLSKIPSKLFMKFKFFTFPE